MKISTRRRIIIVVSILYLAENEVHIQFSYQFCGLTLLLLTDSSIYSAYNLFNRVSLVRTKKTLHTQKKMGKNIGAGLYVQL